MAAAVIFQIGSLGDSLVSLPAIRSVRELIPDAAEFIVVFQGAPSSRVKPGEVFDLALQCSRKLQYDLYPNRLLMALSAAKLALTLRALRPKYAVYLMPSDRTVAQVERDRKFFTAAGIRHLMGFQACTCPANLPVFDVRRTEAFLRFSRLWGADSLDRFLKSAETPLIHLRPEHREFAAGWLKSNRRFPSRPLVAVAPFSNWSSKDLPIATVRTVAGAIENSLSAEALLIGGEKDRSQAELIGCGLNACGAFTVAQSAAILRDCAALVGADSGPMHLAGALGIPTVAAFSRIAPDLSRWLPMGSNHTIIYRDVPCSGCGLKACSVPGHPCMQEIRAESIVAALFEKLKGDCSYCVTANAHSWGIPAGAVA